MAGKSSKGTKSAKRGRKVRTWEWAVIGAVGLGAAWLAWDWQRGGVAEEDFLELARQGTPQLSRIERQASTGSGHLQPGQSVSYADRFPTSGSHDPDWIRPGVYDEVQPPPKLVHSLEHGLVVIYYDTPPARTMKTLESWAGMYGGQWSGIVLAPAPGLGEGLVLTAWKTTLRLDTFEPAAAAAFIDRYRGRGPENPVR